ncbi:MAG: sigma 54-interacting transcriptional regulator [Terriglobia bacterium]|jgi:formate hydrogenlyase transcriptional activator
MIFPDGVRTLADQDSAALTFLSMPCMSSRQSYSILVGMTDASSPVEESAPKPAASQHQVLLEVAESIATHRDLPGLFHDLVERLPRLVNFETLWLVLHEPARNVMRVHILETPSRTYVDFVERTIQDAPAGWVWERQEALVVPDLETEKRFQQALDSLREIHVRSFCILPLTTAHRRVGAVGFGSQQVGTYGEAGVEFLQLVAKQIAVAVDNALNYQAARTLQQQLEHERDRLRLLLDLNNSVVSTLDLRELFRAISAKVRQVMDCDYASVLLPEKDGRQLRVYARDFSQGGETWQEEIVVPAAGRPASTVLASGQPLVLDRQALGRYGPQLNLWSMGLQSLCVLPMISRGRVIGTLNLGRLREGAFSHGDVDFLSQVAKQIAIGVENALNYKQISEARERLAEERNYLTEEIRTEHDFEAIIGQSPALKRILKQAELVAPTGSTVLIMGETGTGKEVLARAIHDISPRRERTFVSVNCAAIPLGLLESELFGHEKGAFTGAIAQKPGRFELAHQGTLFLDEVGDIPPELQPKLLRVLQEQEFERLGSTRTLHVDARVVAATSRDLAQMVENREFRSDLYYRLNIFPILVPPLRERPEDIPLLVAHFTDKYARRMDKRISRIPAETMDALKRYHWPGNVRELQNFIERATILTSGVTLHAPLSELRQASREVPRKSRTLAESDRDQIMRALRESQWVLGGPGGAAERLGLKRTTLFYKMRKLGITRPPS